MSFFKDPQFVKWVLDADLEHIRLHDSTIRGFSDRNVDIEGDNQNITLSVEKLLKSTLSVTPQGRLGTPKFAVNLGQWLAWVVLS